MHNTIDRKNYLLQQSFTATRTSVVNIYCSVLQAQHVRDFGCIKAVLSWQKEIEAFCVTDFNLKETAQFPALSVSMAASLAACTGVPTALGNFQGSIQECWGWHSPVFTCSFKDLNSSYQLHFNFESNNELIA